MTKLSCRSGTSATMVKPDTPKTIATAGTVARDRKPIRIRFDSHGLGDVVAACHAMRLYIKAGYDVAVQVEANKRWVWEAAGIPIYDGPEKLPAHPYPYPDKFWDLDAPDHLSSKIAHVFEHSALPKLGSKPEVWEMICSERFDATDAITQDAHDEAEAFLEGMPRPIIAVHSKGTNWQAGKSIPDGVALELIVSLLRLTAGSVIVLDFDCRAPMVGDARCKGIKPSWGHIGVDRLCALLQRVDLMIGVDSGPFHVAGMIPKLKALGVFRQIPPVRCCLPNPNATYMVPDRDHHHWSKRSDRWTFIEYGGDSPSGEEIAEVAERIVSDRPRISMTLDDVKNIAGHYIYHRVGHDQRPMEFRSDGTIGEGAGGCERRWNPEPSSNGWRIAVTGDKGDVRFRLELCADGVLRGRWLYDERMPIELIPCKQSLTGPAVNISSGIYQQWTPDEAAEVFSTYRPEWNLTVATRGNGKVWLLDPNLAHSDIDLHDHEDWIFKHLQVPTGGVYVDVGGYVGSDAIHIAAGCKATVIVIEPVPLHQEMIRKNAILNGVELQIVPCAAGAIAGTIWMDSNSMNSLQTTQGQGLEVEARTIDEICRELQRLDVMKIDVEGAECEVVEGAMDTIRRLKPKLIIEVHGHFPGRQDNGTILADQLRQLDYSYRRIWSNTEAYFYIEAVPN